jgi:hypothetical protein
MLRAAIPMRLRTEPPQYTNRSISGKSQKTFPKSNRKKTPLSAFHF